MKILAVGDVCGSIGCDAFRRIIPNLKRQYGIDAVVVNGENSADGNGITPQSAESLFASGADIITGGNHSLRRKEVYEYLDSNNFVLRPDNLKDAQFGKGYCFADFGFVGVSVINLSGTIFMPSHESENPFSAADALIDKAKQEGAGIILVDFHAETTSEKKALALYLDGRISALFGTHTHIQTADEQILKGGTGYITDLGMTGPKDSVLGVKSEIIINRLKSGDTSKFELAEGECILNGCIFEIDHKTGMTTDVKRINIYEGEEK